MDAMRKDPWIFQQQWFQELILSNSTTTFLKEHNLNANSSLKQFQNLVPLRDYDQMESFIERIRKGEENLLTTAPIKWFAKSSGTSSAKSKFIPITASSLKYCHMAGMKCMLSNYINLHPKSKILDGDALTLGGSITVDELGKGSSCYGDLSAILLKNSPFWVELRRVPKRAIALISDFEKKLDIMCKEAVKYNVTNFSGVPSWNLVLMRAILQHTGKKNLLELWSNLELFMHGGINFDPYREEYRTLIPSDQMHYMESYNASEGYFAFQDQPDDNSLLLLTDNGVFYEFIPMERFGEAIDGTYTEFETIESVKTGINYALVLTTNGGLWRYLIGDTIRFTSLKPHKIVITGRTQLFINAFGEELMINNVERAIAAACEKHNAIIENYTVAPTFMDENKKGSHQWLIEFSVMPDDIDSFTESLDAKLAQLNSDYEAKRRNDTTMVIPTVTILKPGTFYEWMKQRGKLGGQNKVPRLYPTRIYAEELLQLNKIDNLS